MIDERLRAQQSTHLNATALSLKVVVVLLLETTGGT
jgi:hypothetical protein